MHELSIATAVVGTALKHAEGRTVTVVGVRVGRLRQVVPDSLRFYFDIVAGGGPCDGARLELDEVEARLHCSSCGHEWEPLWPEFRCQRCTAGAVEVLSGEELLVDYIEVEESQAKEPECIAPR